MSKLQEIALAIKNCGAYSPDWQGGDEDLLIMARAAVGALRSPSITMWSAAESYNTRAMRDWEAMISAILNETPE